MARFDDPVLFTDDVTITRNLNVGGGMTIPSGIINNNSIVAAAEISASKVVHRHAFIVGLPGGTDVVDTTAYIFLARAAGSIKSLKVRPLVAPTGGDKAFTVDLKRAPDASGTFTTLLSSVVTVNSTSVDQTVQDGTLIATPSIAANDLIQVVIDATGTTGSQGQGVIVEVEIDESGI